MISIPISKNSNGSVCQCNISIAAIQGNYHQSIGKPHYISSLKFNTLKWIHYLKGPYHVVIDLLTTFKVGSPWSNQVHTCEFGIVSNAGHVYLIIEVKQSEQIVLIWSLTITSSLVKL